MESNRPCSGGRPIGDSVISSAIPSADKTEVCTAAILRGDPVRVSSSVVQRAWLFRGSRREYGRPSYGIMPAYVAQCAKEGN